MPTFIARKSDCKYAFAISFVIVETLFSRTNAARGAVEVREMSSVLGSFQTGLFLSPCLKRGSPLRLNIEVTYRSISVRTGTFVYHYNGETEDIGDHEMELDEDTNTCPSSISVANGEQVVCAGRIIFYDSFNENDLDLKKWKLEHRIAGEPDYEFVRYSNHSIKTATTNGLRIEPKLFKDVFGKFSLRRSFVVENCTSDRESMDCIFDRLIFRNNIAPPIVSSQISTSGLFSFKYGRIEIEAKLPRGDWIFPQLWLQRKGHPRTNYDAGLVIMAKIENYPIGIRLYTQGVVLGAEEPVRSVFLAQRIVQTHDFHSIKVEWRPGGWIIPCDLREF